MGENTSKTNTKAAKKVKKKIVNTPNTKVTVAIGCGLTTS